MRKAYYDDGTGLCFWCPVPAIDEFFGVPLCEKHHNEEVGKFLSDIGLP